MANMVHGRVIKLLVNILGFVVTLAIILLFFCGFRCLVEFRLPISLPLLLALIAALGFIMGLSRWATLIRSYATGIVLALLLGLVVHILLPKMPEECCDPCIEMGSTDQPVFLKLINKEAEAVLNEHMSIIKEIFAPDSLICDARNNATRNPEEYYLEKFRKEKHYEIEHFALNIRSLDVNEHWIFTSGAWIEGDNAHVSTGSRGRWSWENDNHIMTYNNSPGSDQWYFTRRNRCCCWKITKFTFNAE